MAVNISGLLHNFSEWPTMGKDIPNRTTKKIPIKNQFFLNADRTVSYPYTWALETARDFLRGFL